MPDRYDELSRDQLIEELRRLKGEINLLDAALDAQRDTFFVFDPETGKAIRWNRAFRLISGYSDEEIMRLKAPESYYSREDLEANAEAIDDLVRGENVTVEMELITKDGKRVPTEYMGAPFVGEHGGAKHVIAIGRDVTVRNQAARELRKSEERYRTLFQTMSQGVGYINRDGELFAANEAALRILGLTLDEIKRRTSTDPRSKAIHEDGSELTGESHPSMVALKTGQPVRDKVIGLFNPQKQEYSWINVNAVPMFRPGESTPYQAYALFEDITKRKVAENKLAKQIERTQKYIDIAGVIIIALNERGEVQLINQKGCEILGYEKHEIEGENWFHSFLPVDLRQQVFREFQRSIRGETKSMEFYENPVLTASGKERLISWHNALIFDEKERIVGTLSSGEDITDRRQMEEQLRQSEKMQAIGQLAGGVAHDFNNQLAGIAGFASLLRGRLNSETSLASYVDQILVAVRRAGDLTGQLLAFSRGGKRVSTVVDLHEVIHEVISLLQRSIDKKITIEPRLNASPACILGDPSQLQNAVLNLALNARDAIPNRGSLVFETKIITYDHDYCRFSPYDIEAGDYVRLDVRDTGTGMEPSVVERIFEPFFTTKEKGKGTGMGLAAVYGMIKSHRGCIEVHSKVGEGTDICLSFPLVRDQFPARTEQVNADKNLSKPIHILLVEDEEPVRVTVAEMLEAMGHKVSLSQNGEEAVAFFERNWRIIDLVLLDMVMPVMDGKETFKEMKKINPQIVALLASGYILDETAQEVMNQGVRGILHKPFTSSQLAQKITEILEPSLPGDL